MEEIAPVNNIEEINNIDIGFILGFTINFLMYEIINFVDDAIVFKL